MNLTCIVVDRFGFFSGSRRVSLASFQSLPVCFTGDFRCTERGFRSAQAPSRGRCSSSADRFGSFSCRAASHPANTRFRAFLQRTEERHPDKERQGRAAGLFENCRAKGDSGDGFQPDRPGVPATGGGGVRDAVLRGPRNVLPLPLDEGAGGVRHIGGHVRGRDAAGSCTIPPAVGDARAPVGDGTPGTCAALADIARRKITIGDFSGQDQQIQGPAEKGLLQ